MDYGSTSQYIERYISGIFDQGAIGLVTIFEDLAAGEHTIRLRQATSDANQQLRASNISLVAIPLITSDGSASFDFGIDTLPAPGTATSSTSLEPVEGLSTTVDLECYGRILVTAAINNCGQDCPLSDPGSYYGIWDLQINNMPVGMEIPRYLSDEEDIGAISLSGLSDILPPGTYTITMRHATSIASRPITTLNATLLAIALVDDMGSGYAIPAAEATFSASTGTTSINLVNIAPSRVDLDLTGVNGPLGGYSDIFVAASFANRVCCLGGGSGYALHDITIDGIPVTEKINRYLHSDDDSGSGELYGLSDDWSPQTHTGYLRHATSDPLRGISTGDCSLIIMALCSREQPCQQPSPTPSVTPTSTPSVTPTPSAAPTSTPSPSPTGTPSPKPTSTPTTTPTVAPTPKPTATPGCQCFVVAQEGFEDEGGNLLTRVDTGDFDPATNETNIGSSTGTGGIESIAYDYNTQDLYAVNYNQLGILDQRTGKFTPAPRPIGSGYGKLGLQSFSEAKGSSQINDIDGLTFHPETGILYGSVRRDGNDLLIQIDIGTGALIPGAFGGADYLVVENLYSSLDDIDDIAFDPTDGTLYAIMNNRGRYDHLVIINTFDGSVTAIDPLHNESTRVYDMEGLGFGCDGTLWGITGNKTIPEHTDRLWEIDKNRAEVSNPRVLDNGTDYEAVTCGFFSPPTPATLILESGDYDGDGTSDIALFRGSSGLWVARGITRVYFGNSNDQPVSGDYNGDGTTDIGIFREISGLWSIRRISRIYFGSSSDTAVPDDYDGDGSCDIGVFRSASGLWALQGISRFYFGASGDMAAPGDYNGDGAGDVAVFRGSSGLWAIRSVSRIYFGGSSSRAVSGDYNGDGTWETGVFHGSSGLWAIRGVTRAYFGGSADQPVLADYEGSGADNFGIFRDTSGLWAVRGITRVYFGSSGDIPVTR